MSARPSYLVLLAVGLVLDRGYTISAAARKHGVAITSVRRALRRLGEPPRPPGRISDTPRGR